MSLNPSTLSDPAFASESPSAKLTFNINAFNGNTTNFNRRPSPKSTSTSTSTSFSPVQPRNPPTFPSTLVSRPVGSLMPM